MPERRMPELVEHYYELKMERCPSSVGTSFLRCPWMKLFVVQVHLLSVFGFPFLFSRFFHFSFLSSRFVSHFPLISRSSLFSSHLTFVSHFPLISLSSLIFLYLSLILFFNFLLLFPLLFLFVIRHFSLFLWSFLC